MLNFDHKANRGELITLAAVGDVLLHDSLQKQAARVPGRFYSLWSPVADLIGAADVAFANYEGVAAANITPKGKRVRLPRATVYDGEVYSGYPRFNAHPSVLRDLKRAGFNVLLTANNHSLDRFAPGVDGTAEAIADLKLAWTGTKSRRNMSRPWHAVTPVVKDGKRYNIAWLGCTYGTNKINDRHRQVLHCYRDRTEVLNIIRKLSQDPDIHAVIATPHWGDENVHTPDIKECVMARDMADAGATAIIGTQPHVMQPIEKLVAADGREVPVAYSIGNFVSNQKGLAARSSIILLLGLSPRADNGKLAVASLGWIPIRMVKRPGILRAEAIDRGTGGEAYRAHLLEHLPAGNLLPPTAPFWPTPAGVAARPQQSAALGSKP